jgi:hypothetical protein
MQSTGVGGAVYAFKRTCSAMHVLHVLTCMLEVTQTLDSMIVLVRAQHRLTKLSVNSCILLSLILHVILHVMHAPSHSPPFSLMTQWDAQSNRRWTIAQQFRKGMTWDIYGARGWHIDHKRPIIDFEDLNEWAQQLACLGRKWWHDNLAKGCDVKYETPSVSQLSTFSLAKVHMPPFRAQVMRPKAGQLLSPLSEPEHLDQVLKASNRLLVVKVPALRPEVSHVIPLRNCCACMSIACATVRPSSVSRFLVMPPGGGGTLTYI